MPHGPILVIVCDLYFGLLQRVGVDVENCEACGALPWVFDSCVGHYPGVLCASAFMYAFSEYKSREEELQKELAAAKAELENLRSKAELEKRYFPMQNAR